MVIDNFDIVSIAAFPAKTDAPPVVDSNAVSAGAVPFESFQAIAGRVHKVFQSSRPMQKHQLAPGDSLDPLKAMDDTILEQQGSLATAE